MLQNTLHQVEDSLDSLTGVLGDRVKRSWFGIAQTAVKVINGIINADEINAYENLIKQEVSNNKVTINEMQGKVRIFSSNLTTQYNKFKSLEASVDFLHAEVQKFHKLTEFKINALGLKQHLQATNSYGLTIQQDIQNIFTAIMFAKKNIIHPNILSPKNLLSELIISTKFIQNNLHFPYALLEQNTESIINLADVKVFKISELLIFVIRIPLAVDETYDLYKLIPFPTKIFDNKFIYVKPRQEYLLINEQRTIFSLLPNMEKCKHVHPELLICETDKPLFTRLKNRMCEVELLSETTVIPKDCNIKIIQLESEIWEKIHFFNTWVYVVPNPTDLKVICPNGTKEYLIENSGAISLNSECWALTPSIQLYPQPIKFSEKYLSVVPKANLPSIVIPFKEKIEKYIKRENDNNFVTSVQNFNDLNSAGISVQLMLNDDASVMINLNITIAILSVSLVIVIGILCFFLRKCCTRETTEVTQGDNKPLTNEEPRYAGDSNKDTNWKISREQMPFELKTYLGN